MRDQRFRGNGAPSRGRAASDACGFRSGPDPVVQHMVEREADGMLNRAGRRGGRAGADDFVGVGEQRPYWKPCGIGGSVPLRGQVIRSYIGPECVRGIGPGTAFVDALPHFIKRRVVSSARLQIDENVSISRRVGRAFHGGVCRNWAGGEVGLIDGGCDRYVRLVVRNFDGWDSIREGSIRIVSEEWFYRRGQIAAVHRRGGGSVYGKAGGGRVHAMMKDGS